MDNTMGTKLCGFANIETENPGVGYLYNASLVVGWIPLIGTIVGIARLALTKMIVESDPPYYSEKQKKALFKSFKKLSQSEFKLRNQQFSDIPEIQNLLNCTSEKEFKNKFKKFKYDQFSAYMDAIVAGDYQRMITTQFLRGAVETLSLGFLFAIPDILFTIGRAVSNHNSQKEFQAATV